LKTTVGTEKWRTLMSAEDQAVVLRVAGDALVAYGYASEAERVVAIRSAPVS